MKKHSTAMSYAEILCVLTTKSCFVYQTAKRKSTKDVDINGAVGKESSCEFRRFRKWTRRRFHTQGFYFIYL